MRKEDFCYPKDFFFVDSKGFKTRWDSNKLKTIIALGLYMLMATISFLGYYILLPFRLLHEWCESFCYW